MSGRSAAPPVSEMREGAAGARVVIKSNGEALFSRRFDSEEHALYVANGLKHDELKAGEVVFPASEQRVVDLRQPGIVWDEELLHA